MAKIFLTGATGTVGSYLLKELTNLGHHVTILIRATSEDHAIQRLVEINSKTNLGVDFSKISLILGDLHSVTWLSNDFDFVYHCAADTRFKDKYRTNIFRTNLDGTKSLIRVVEERCPRTRFVYVSTAFVCGLTEGLWTEHDFNTEGMFDLQNPYPTSKHLAEMTVRNSTMETTIVRPSIIMAENPLSDFGVEGYLKSFWWPTMATKKQYPLLRPLLRNGNFPIPIPHGNKTLLNVVDGTWVAKMLARLTLFEQPNRCVLHLTDHRPRPVGELIDIGLHKIGLFNFERFDPTNSTPTLSTPLLLRRLANTVTRYSSPFHPFVNGLMLFSNEITKEIYGKYWIDPVEITDEWFSQRVANAKARWEKAFPVEHQAWLEHKEQKRRKRKLAKA